MSGHMLRGRRILIVEDEYLLADELRAELTAIGATIVGPIGTLDGAIERIGADSAIDGALLDVNLRGDLVFRAAELLQKSGVPFVFTTGYEASVIPPPFDTVVRCEKPVEMAKVTTALGQAMGLME